MNKFTQEQLTTMRQILCGEWRKLDCIIRFHKLSTENRENRITEARALRDIVDQLDDMLEK